MLSFSTFTRSLFLNKVAGLQPTTLFKKCLLYKCFPLNFAKFSEHIFCRTALLTALAKYPLVLQTINLAFFLFILIFFQSKYGGSVSICFSQNSQTTSFECINILVIKQVINRSNRSQVFLGKVILKICNKFAVENSCQSCKAVLLKSHFGIGCSPLNLLHISRTPLCMNTYGRLLLNNPNILLRIRSSLIAVLK